jgi:hypothetical protein
MAKLTKKEADLLAKLTAKAEAPDEPAIGRSVSAVVDLSDDKAVGRALKLGLLEAGDVGDDDGDDEGDGEDDEEGDEPPTRRGYFPSRGKE